jgi:flagellin
MLNRMYQLAEQSANGTYNNEVDREQLQKEVTSILEEINRIADNSNFNGLNLLDGSFVSKNLQIGDSAGETLEVKIATVSTDHIGGMGTVGEDGNITISGGVDISELTIATQDDANAAIDVIKEAINNVSDIRGGLGAIQNRLEHTINNLSVMQENMQDAESNIRDTDVANEMMKYTKNSILVQSAQAMLAQANQQPQGVLQLLQ